MSVLVASEDPRESIQPVLDRLRSNTVRQVEVDLPGFDLHISFESGHFLSVFPIYANSEDYENWSIQTLDGHDIVAGPGRQVQIVPSY